MAKRRKRGDPDPDDELFSWGNEYVRKDDPQTSHDAEARVDKRRDSYKALAYFKELASRSADGVTATEFEQYVEVSLLRMGFDEASAHRKAESLRRRLSDLCWKYREIECRDKETGKPILKKKEGKPRRRKRQQIYYLPEDNGAVQGTVKT